MGKKITHIPEFASAAEERAWWAEHGANVDLDAFPVETMTFDIKPRRAKSRVVTIRMEPELLDRYEALAQARDMTITGLMREVLDRWSRLASR